MFNHWYQRLENEIRYPIQLLENLEIEKEKLPPDPYPEIVYFKLIKILRNNCLNLERR